MSRILIITLLIFAANTYAQEPYKIRPTVQQCVNIRDDASTDANIINCLAANTPVTVLDSKPYWRQISFNQSDTGWVAKKFLIPTPQPPPSPVPDPLPADMWMTVHFIDVGQGDAIWIHTADDDIDGNGIFEGKNIIIDGGRYSSNDNNPLLQYLESSAHHLAPVDALIVTHPHDDHYAGAEALTRHFDVEDYYDPGFPGTSSYDAFILSFNQADHHVNNTHIGPGNHGNLDWGDELTAEFIYTWPGTNTGLGSGSTRKNNSSMVLKITYGSQSFLFMGDAEGKDRDDPPSTPKYVEKILIDGNADLDSTVLKIAHHGSETSSTHPFIDAVDPDYVIVQSGRKCYKPHYLPDMSTLLRYCTHNPDVQIYRTDEGDVGLATRDAVNGDDVVLRSNGHEIEVDAGVQAQCSELAGQAGDQDC